jgi:hypothetical protein
MEWGLFIMTSDDTSVAFNMNFNAFLLLNETSPLMSFKMTNSYNPVDLCEASPPSALQSLTALSQTRTT